MPLPIPVNIVFNLYSAIGYIFNNLYNTLYMSLFEMYGPGQYTGELLWSRYRLVTMSRILRFLYESRHGNPRWETKQDAVEGLKKASSFLFCDLKKVYLYFSTCVCKTPTMYVSLYVRLSVATNFKILVTAI